MSTSRAWRRNISILAVVAFCTFIMVPAGLAQESEPIAEEGGTANEAALGVGSFLLTIPYGATKIAFAIVGGVVGGLAWVCTGGNNETAQNVWKTSAYGTYIVTPEHLKGNKPVRFLGVPEEDAAGEDLSGTE
jgi:hypothetical protein